jgi:hypothetical protein
MQAGPRFSPRGRRLGLSAAFVFVALSVTLTGSRARAWESPTADFMCNGSAQKVPWGHKWKTLPVGYYVWAESGPPSLTAQQAIEGTQNAFAEWAAVTSAGVRAEYLGTRENTFIGDGKNDVVWLHEAWYATTGSSKPSDMEEILGLTFTQRDWFTGTSSDSCPPPDRCPEKDKPCAAGESDIFLNAELATPDWSLVTDGTSLPFAVLTHEVGHFLGLGHSVGQTPVPLMDPNPVFLPGQPLLRPDDVDGMTALYPKDAPLCEGDLECVVGNPCAANCEDLSGDICKTGECARAERCEAGACVDATGLLGSLCATFAGGPACDTGLECVVSAEQSIGRCSGPCTGDEQCAPAGKCRESVAGGEMRCVFPGDLADGAACAADTECKSAACVANRCADSCDTDCECEYGSACRAGACLRGRSTCYFADGRDADRKLTATVCAVTAAPHDAPFTPLATLAAASALLLRRRRTATCR